MCILDVFNVYLLFMQIFNSFKVQKDVIQNSSDENKVYFYRFYIIIFALITLTIFLNDCLRASSSKNCLVKIF